MKGHLNHHQAIIFLKLINFLSEYLLFSCLIFLNLDTLIN